MELVKTVADGPLAFFEVAGGMSDERHVWVAGLVFATLNLARPWLLSNVTPLVDGDGNWPPSCVVEAQGRQYEVLVLRRAMDPSPVGSSSQLEPGSDPSLGDVLGGNLRARDQKWSMVDPC